MRWWAKWWKMLARRRSGDAASAVRDARDQRSQAHAQTSTVDHAIRRARGAITRADLFVRDTEGSWRPKETR